MGMPAEVPMHSARAWSEARGLPKSKSSRDMAAFSYKSAQLQQTNLCSELDSEIEERCIAQKPGDAEEHVDFTGRRVRRGDRGRRCRPATLGMAHEEFVRNETDASNVYFIRSGGRPWGPLSWRGARGCSRQRGRQARATKRRIQKLLGRRGEHRRGGLQDSGSRRALPRCQRLLRRLTRPPLAPR